MAKDAVGQDSLIGRTLGHYRIVAVIGAGGMGVVYRAHDEHLDRDVAIKILPPGLLANVTARQRFHKEAHALSKLNHPNIATVHDFDSCDGIDYLAEELVAGVSLDEMLSSGPLSETEIVNLGTQLCEGLAAAHGRGVLHRDIKPSNLRVTPDGNLKIVDFGLAKTVAIAGLSGDEQPTLSETQAVSGTLPYMSPEQLRNEKLDARTDIWAAGCVLYEMATGRRPFVGQGTALIEEILHHPPVAPSKLNHKASAGLEAIIQKCMEKDAALRYGSAHEIAIDLRRFQAGESSGTLHAVGSGRWSSAKWVGLGLGILVAVVVALFASSANYWRERLHSETGATSIKSLAVLPIKNFSGDPGQEYFADGMTDELIASLAQLKAVKVISRTSVMHYKGTNETLPQIAKELNVDGIVEASVLRSGDRVRLTAQLIDARQDRHLWAENYERNMTDVLMLQSELVQAIAGEIRVQITPQETERLKRARPVDPEVYDNTLRGKATLEYAADENQIRQAIELFERAVDRDPTYAAAWAGLGEAWWTLASLLEFVPPESVRAKAIAAAEKALELDGNLAEAHKARAVIAIDGDWNLDLAEQHFKRALDLRPGYAAAHIGYAQILEIQLGRFDEARRHLDRARELDPLSPWNDYNLVAWWVYQGQSEKALEEARRASQSHPSLWTFPAEIGALHLLRGEPGQAVSQFELALKLVQGEQPTVLLAWLGLAYGLTGRRTEALRILTELEQGSRKHYVSPLHLAVAYSGLGRMDDAFRLLDQALAQRTPSLVFCAPNDPTYVALRRDPRWPAFLARLRQKVLLPPGTPNPYHINGNVVR